MYPIKIYLEVLVTEDDIRVYLPDGMYYSVGKEDYTLLREVVRKAIFATTAKVTLTTNKILPEERKDDGPSEPLRPGDANYGKS